MNRDFERRLERLEAAAPPAPPAGVCPMQKLLMLLLAYHRGGWQQPEPPIAAWGRALGYQLNPDLLADLKTKPGEVSRRDMRARRALFASQGVDLGRTSWAETAAAIAALVEQVPEGLRARLGLQAAIDALIGPEGQATD